MGNQKKLMKDLKAFLMESDYPTTRTLAQSVYAQADTTSKTTLIQEAITKILKEHWYAERQAVFNLLSFPGLIPHDVVLKYILKGSTPTSLILDTVCPGVGGVFVLCCVVLCCVGCCVIFYCVNLCSCVVLLYCIVLCCVTGSEGVGKRG